MSAKLRLGRSVPKGVIAIAVGGLLLAGGGGTFALWHANSTGSVAPIQSGHLTIDDTEVSGWYHDSIPADVVGSTNQDGK